MARTVGLLQVALQLLLPLAVGRLLLAQAPVLALKLQERLPADQTPGSDRCWDRSPAAGGGDQERGRALGGARPDPRAALESWGPGLGILSGALGTKVAGLGAGPRGDAGRGRGYRNWFEHVREGLWGRKTQEWEELRWESPSGQGTGH